TVTNNNDATVTITGNLTGGSAASQWTQGSNSYLKVAAAIVAVGVLDASASGNTVEYSGSGQTVKVPSSNYTNLTFSSTNNTGPSVTVAGVYTVTGTGSVTSAAGT